MASRTLIFYKETVTEGRREDAYRVPHGPVTSGMQLFDAKQKV